MSMSKAYIAANLSSIRKEHIVNVWLSNLYVKKCTIYMQKSYKNNQNTRKDMIQFMCFVFYWLCQCKNLYISPHCSFLHIFLRISTYFQHILFTYISETGSVEVQTVWLPGGSWQQVNNQLTPNWGGHTQLETHLELTRLELTQLPAKPTLTHF